jgi:hypothetical protein
MARTAIALALAFGCAKSAAAPVSRGAVGGDGREAGATLQCGPVALRLPPGRMEGLSFGEVEAQHATCHLARAVMTAVIKESYGEHATLRGFLCRFDPHPSAVASASERCSRRSATVIGLVDGA